MSATSTDLFTAGTGEEIMNTQVVVNGTIKVLIVVTSKRVVKIPLENT